MKKAIKALWHGINAVFTAMVNWIATLFGMKDNSKYGRVLRRVTGSAFALLVLTVAVLTLVRFGRNIYWSINNSCGIYTRQSDIHLADSFGDNLFYYDDTWGDKGYLADSNGRKLLKHILYIRRPLDGDSLVYFSDGDKRGYFHMRDGHVVVKPTYEHAWVFSEGLAAVEEKGRILFIDTTGHVAIDGGFAYNQSDDGYVFHRGHCAVNDASGRHMGLIDTAGCWVIEPQCTLVLPVDTFWLVRWEDRQAVLTFDLDTVIPATQGTIYIEDTAIYVTLADHTQHVYSRQGKLVADNQIRNVKQLMYNTDEMIYQKESDYNEEAEEYDTYLAPTTRQAVATCFQYESEPGWYGLLSPEGHRLTPPSFLSIKAVDKDLYLCETTHGNGRLLNSRGQEVE